MDTPPRSRYYHPRWITLFIVLTVCASLVLHRILVREVDHTPAVTLTSDEQTFTVSYLDVEDGDCILLRAPGGESAMIDTGTRNAFTRVKRYLAEMGVKKLDYLILSHFHEDHAEAAPAILEYMEIQNLMTPNICDFSPLVQQITDGAEQRNCKTITIRAGSRISLGEATLTFLTDGSETPDNDNSSVILLLQYGKRRFLFTGDSERAQENDLLDRPTIMKADVLKVAHHGSKTSTGEEFLAEISPQYAVISVGEANPYHLPDYETVSRLEQAGVQIFTTAKNGTIRMETDGEKIKVFSEK